jgi:hypothetical protein
MRVSADRRNVHQRHLQLSARNGIADHPELECPRCGETQKDRLIWLDMERVRCTCCGATFHVWANRAD